MGKACIIALLLLLLGPEVRPEPAPAPGREVSLPSSEVKDAFFAYLLGLIVRDGEAEIEGGFLRGILIEYKDALSIPLERIERISLRRDPAGGGNRMEVSFRGDVDIPIPFSFLGYHPGTIHASRLLTFREPRPDQRAPPSAVPAFEFRLSEGEASVDVDEWLDVLLGDYLDDIELRRIVVFRYEGEWIGLLSGLGYKRQPIAGYFSFPKNHIVFPVPDALAELGMAFLRPQRDK
jgi:hypothetical protein